MTRSVRASLLATTLLVCLVSPAHAGMLTFTSLTDWQTAVGASQTENFNGFAADTTIELVSVPLNGMSVTGTDGFNVPEGQMIDAGAGAFGGYYTNDGTPYLLADVASQGVLRFDFTIPVTAWSAEFVGIGDAGRPTEIRAFDVNGGLLGTIFPSSNASNQEQQFYGLQLTAGDQAGYLEIGYAGQFVNDEFGIDDVRFVAAVPEPATLLLLGSGLAAAAARRRQRSKN